MGESLPPKKKKTEEPERQRNPLFIFEAPQVAEKKPLPSKEPLKDYTKYQKELHRRIITSND